MSDLFLHNLPNFLTFLVNIVIEGKLISQKCWMFVNKILYSHSTSENISKVLTFSHFIGVVIVEVNKQKLIHLKSAHF